jgi:hypothetical protein
MGYLAVEGVKKFLNSKINWVGFGLILEGLLESAQYSTFIKEHPVWLSGVGFALVIIRTYWTRKSVAGPIKSYLPPPPAARW